jgi:hypothetical protein
MIGCQVVWALQAAGDEHFPDSRPPEDLGTHIVTCPKDSISGQPVSRSTSPTSLFACFDTCSHGVAGGDPEAAGGATSRASQTLWCVRGALLNVGMESRQG